MVKAPATPTAPPAAVNTTNSYGSAGDLTNTVYSDSTPAVATVYDRRGRPVKYSLGSTSTTSLLYNDAGQVLSQARDGLTVTNSYDSLLRRARLGFGTNFGSTLFTNVYAYDGASRLLSVSDGTNSATYTYLANSPLVSQILFTNNGTLRMSTTKAYDNLNRLTGISSAPSAASAVSFNYAYNSANQRTAITNADNSRWAYGYDSLGQVTSGKRSWADGSIVTGQQFEYGFDDIGNRRVAASGGDPLGANLRYQNYTPNNLNQYTQRAVPGFVNILGTATNTATVTVNAQPTSRKGDYYRQELTVTNSTAAVWQGVTNVGFLPQSTNSEIISGVTGSIFVAQSPESFGFDADGNQTTNGRWTLSWDAKNQLTSMVSVTNAPTSSKRKLDFTYDYLGRRVQKIVSTNNGSSYVGQYTNRFVYDGWNVVAILDPGNGLLYSFRWGTDASGTMQDAGGVGGLISMTVHSGSLAGVYFYCYDGNHNVVALISAADGTVVAQYEYGPFG